MRQRVPAPANQEKIVGTKVRILTDVNVQGVDYKPNQVVDVPAAIAKQLAGAGSADASADAVAYCVDELKAEVIVHQKPESGDTEQSTDPQ